MPRFCRHNRFVQNCPICREPDPPGTAEAPRRRRAPAARTAPRSAGLRIRPAAGRSDDGYRCPLVPGLKLGDDARRLADELAFASGRLAALATDPQGPYAEVAAEPNLEEAAWLALLIAYVGPLDGARSRGSARCRTRRGWPGRRLQPARQLLAGHRRVCEHHDHRAVPPVAWVLRCLPAGTQMEVVGRHAAAPGRPEPRALRAERITILTAPVAA